MELMTESNRHVYQNAAGDGDNVGRDKYVTIYQKLAPEALRKPIELILSSIRERKQDIAKVQLEIIKSTDLDTNSKAILDMVSIQLNLLEDDEKLKAQSSLLSIFKTSTDSNFRDLCLAILIQLDAKNKRIEDARDRYLRESAPLSYSQEAFYEFVATAEELEKAYQENRLDLDESVLNGLVRGALRTQCIELSLNVANRLNNIFPSNNTKILLLFATACDLDRKLSNKHFWTITATLKTEILNLIDEIVFLINELKGTDSRLFHIAAPYWYNLQGEHKELNDICSKYVDEIEKIRPEIGSIIRQVNFQDSSSMKDFDSKCVKASRDKNYRIQLLDEIFSKKEISNDDFVIISRFSDFKNLTTWVDSGGKIIGEKDIVTDFNRLKLLILTFPNRKYSDKQNNIEAIKLKAGKFFEKHKERLPFLHPVPLFEITDVLILHPALSVIACDLIKPLLSSSDLWASPIVESYLNALLVSRQMATLASVISSINKTEWNSFVWRIQARLFEQQSDYLSAVNAIKEALKLERNLLDAWHFLSYLHRKMAKTDRELELVLKDIPEEILIEKSGMALDLIIEMAKTGDFARAEKTIISWFVKNPIACAIEITNFFFNLLLNNVDVIPTSEKVGDCIVGVRFKKDGDVLTKLLVDSIKSDNHYLLDIHSKLGNELSQMQVGETKQYGPNDLMLLERLPPYIAALQISLELRHTQNDGSDGFFALKVPEPNELPALLERKLLRNKEGDIFNNPQIPLICKGYFINRHSPVKSALELLTTKSSVQWNFPNFGKGETPEIILDVYSITYLAITGLGYGIDRTSIKFVITQETSMVIEDWLIDINRENYLSVGIGPGGGLWKATADDIREATQDIQEIFRLVMDKATVIEANLVDTPPLILSIQDFVDISVYSSICLSISNNIPWLCIDEFFAYLTRESGCIQADTFKLFTELGSLVDFERKKIGLYLYAKQIIPYALSYNDLRLLSISDDEHAHYFLAKILHLHPKAFSDNETAMSLLTELLTPVLARSYLDGNILKEFRIHNPRNNGYAEKVFNACCYLSMQCNDGDIAERKLATFLFKLFVKFITIPPMIQAIKTMASVFIAGHFMDFPMINACIKEQFDNFELLDG